MIYEFRTYTLKPRTLPDFLRGFNEALVHREKHSKLAACWITEIGPLNQVVHVWGYGSVDERDRIRTDARRDGTWSLENADMIVDMTSEIMMPTPFTPELVPANLGPYFEMRRYTLKPGSAPEMIRRWTERLPKRLEKSPLVGVFLSEIGRSNLWMPIWGYKSLDQRMAIRRELKADGVWPPPGETLVTHQENRILLAAPFSPIR